MQKHNRSIIAVDVPWLFFHGEKKWDLEWDQTCDQSPQSAMCFDGLIASLIGTSQETEQTS